MSLALEQQGRIDGIVIKANLRSCRGLDELFAEIERLILEARLDEAGWWEHLAEQHHAVGRLKHEPCMYCAHIKELESQLEKVKVRQK